ncbi:hypothetical protein NLI96_g12517 [Meripilus lineatus]|uniref:Reverse transcriptase n=1 Tax=Meripilus lineatus TaxID=2056292 RepID=A0AAD5YCC3_9APHY|nr:hypothetical protein NLI96_g12517 [Physisporinus lineatus]
MKQEFKPEDIPEWDGNGKTALNWFASCQELASTGGYLPDQMGSFMWLRLKDGSPIRNWFIMQTPQVKQWMRSHYVYFLEAIKTDFLGDRWQHEQNMEYQAQYFRQAGHKNESPMDFVQRRLTFSRMLTHVPHGGRDEVLEVTKNIPVAWKTIIVVDTIPDTPVLLSRIRDHSDQLELVHRTSVATVLTRDNVMPFLKEALAELNRRKASDRRPFFPARHAQFVSEEQNPVAEIEESDSRTLDTIAEDDLTTSEGVTHEQDPQMGEDHIAVQEVYAITKKRQRKPPPGGYPFPIRNEVKSVLRPPPSPCKCCGSPHHWDKECPWHNVWEKKYGKKKSAKVVEREDMQLEDVYNQAYEALLIHVAYSSYLEESVKTPKRLNHSQLCDLKLAECTSNAEAFLVGTGRHVSYRTSVEEVEDEDERPTVKDYATRYVIEAIGSENLSVEHDVSQRIHQARRESEEEHKEELARIEKNLPNKEKIRWIPQKRTFPEGHSAVGQSVVAVRGKLGDLGEESMDLRLDSCADISLISEECYRGLKNPPLLRKGLKFSLWQLTTKGASILGYVKLPVFMTSEDGETIGMEAEAYVVPGMTVPILLGEDFQNSYELAVARNVAFGTTVHFGTTGISVKAQGTRRTGDHTLVRRSARTIHAHFVKAKTHRRMKAKRRKKKLALERDRKLVRATRDVKIPALTSKMVEISGHLDEDKEWIVESTLLQVDPSHNLVVPNTIIHSSHPFVSIANTSNKALMVRKGEIVGTLIDPDSELDVPKSAERYGKMEEAALRAASLIAIQNSVSLNGFPTDGSPESVPEVKRTFLVEKDGTTHRAFAVETEDYGPKTAAVPESETVSSEKLEEILDIGDLPEELKPRVWTMLRRRIRAFGFDGRLGQLDVKCRIRTKEGVEPISTPMYGASPAKREVIEKQLETWFRQDVIEASQSPWSAPVVIVYRNGKARFCVDYRKLNAATIPDEFPIPRQNEILAALSGAQVLSSLDALAGFTQIEVDQRDVEKTAFRTHKGLFHFKRMPFGLRNGPAIFQRVMQNILAPFLWIFALVYIDDIIVYSKTYEDHIEHLDRLLGAIERAGLTLSPSKCHLFYSSVLLLGHKVSRLGLSTHEEKVRAIMDLRRPTKVSELQTFLGMVVYFSSFIPYYSSIAAPLFHLLRKGATWKWGQDEEYAFQAAKKALLSAPVLGHPIERRPYRLYTDASDEALGCTLQQVQPIKVKDLKGTKAYDRLQKLYESKEAPPKLTVKLSSKILDSPDAGAWGASLDETVVHVERVITYWSRTFKPAETRYSATEREALAAKEGLVKFLPIIEGEEVTLVTDHAALQWAKTYENANKRLAAWGAIFSAYAPLLDIVHRPGRIHSNVDPLSRIPREPPEHTSPMNDSMKSLELGGATLEEREKVAAREPAAKMAFTIRSLEDWSDRAVLNVVPTRRSRRLARKEEERQSGSTVTRKEDRGAVVEAPKESTSEELWKGVHRTPNVTVHLDEELLERFKQGYSQDVFLRNYWKELDEKGFISNDSTSRFSTDERGLVYFRDADFQARLCVPKSMQTTILQEAHESPYESAHASAEKIWLTLNPKFYWPRMKKDIISFCSSCDVCQKTKHSNFKRYGFLKPHAIPLNPYESVSLDLIVNLPWSDEFNAILVTVDRLTKHAQFIPTTTGLTTEGFATLFIKHVACKFGLPTNIVCDRDTRWTSEFWRHVAKRLHTSLLISSSHHPQHDGQTEIVNKQLETMLRAYVAEDRKSWAHWIPILEHSYNRRIHASTGSSPYFLLLGYEPKSPLDFLNGQSTAVRRHALGERFIEVLQMHRESARRAIAQSQVKQARSYNKGRKAMTFEVGDWVLINPHSLEWVESKGEGAKLVQRWIGPFEIQQRIGEDTYRLRLGDNYPGSPVFNLQHLRRYVDSPAEFGPRMTLADTRLGKPATEEYEVERILGHKFDKKKQSITYLVRWKNFDPSHDSWLTPRDLRNAPDLLRDYRRSAGLY